MTNSKSVSFKGEFEKIYTENAGETFLGELSLEHDSKKVVQKQFQRVPSKVKGF